MRQSLVEKLQCPQGFSSYGEILEWLKQEWNVEVKYKTVYRIVRYQLQAKLKIPRRVSKQQDEKAVNLFKKHSSRLCHSAKPLRLRGRQRS
ncbi:MAG: winged helix-turn-helix domain-containing protein [Nostoc sp.]|uniref:winged helix-turn-helix domain-containing protein n=1 Tax=Nostoc sp. TaxID=1180 RepID=UPI00304283A8